MQFSNAPGKIPLPFAASGGKNTIPQQSQILITPGAASLTDGFPPLTRTLISAGGVPPSGLDMNGILYETTAISTWANAGAGYKFDSTFAGNSAVGGYPATARVARSDGLGYWINTVDNNTTDPESSGAAAAGWFPDTTTGAASITMTNANVTLTALQYGRPIIVITGTLTASLNLIFPAIVGKWVVMNNTTGAYTITAKTASGTGVAVSGTSGIVGDGTNIYITSGAAGALLAANNLSDVASASTSLSNLGGLSTSAAASTYAPIASPTFTGTPAAPTASSGTNTTQLATTAFAYGTLSNSTNGYVKLPNGLILQWGTSTSSSSASWPITFPNAVLCATMALKGGAAAGGTVDYMNFYTLTTSGCTFYSTASTRYWMVIGY